MVLSFVVVQGEGEEEAIPGSGGSKRSLTWFKQQLNEHPDYGPQKTQGEPLVIKDVYLDIIYVCVM